MDSFGQQRFKHHHRGSPPRQEHSGRPGDVCQSGGDHCSPVSGQEPPRGGKPRAEAGGSQWVARGSGQLSLHLSPSSLRWDFESQMGSYRTEGPDAFKGSSLGIRVGALSFSFRSQTASFWGPLVFCLSISIWLPSLFGLTWWWRMGKGDLLPCWSL